MLAKEHIKHSIPLSSTLEFSPIPVALASSMMLCANAVSFMSVAFSGKPSTKSTIMDPSVNEVTSQVMAMEALKKLCDKERRNK